jgi:hypothetical protein
VAGGGSRHLGVIIGEDVVGEDELDGSDGGVLCCVSFPMSQQLQFALPNQRKRRKARYTEIK